MLSFFLKIGILKVKHQTLSLRIYFFSIKTWPFHLRYLPYILLAGRTFGRDRSRLEPTTLATSIEANSLKTRKPRRSVAAPNVNSVDFIAVPFFLQTSLS